MQKRYLPFITFSFLITTFPGYAEIYKWVDDKGVTHYGDKPKIGSGGEGAPPQAQQMHLHGTKIYDHIKARTPIPYNGQHDAPLILLNELVLKLKDSDIKDVEIGTRTYSTWTSCINPKPILWSDGFINATDTSLMSAVVAPFVEAKYRMTAGNIMNVSTASGRLMLDATITNLKVDICQSNTSSDNQKAAAYVKINWSLTDMLTRKKLYGSVSEGAENGFDRFKSKGASKALSRAVGMAARNLLADNLFIKQILAAEEATASAQTFAELQVGLHYGDGHSTFKQEINKLKAAAVTVRTTSGHGSGVVIDKAGYILTNAHVVSDSKQVIVVVNNLELPGEVVRTETHRDVALIKTQALTTVEAANITRGRLTEGDTIYVIGTPLDESLSSTITKGVYSAFREHNGLTFYQTDAAVNPGNSGGPVFDERGELLAISVAGVFTRDGASLNVNYLIPIKDALQALNLSKGRDFSYLMAEPATPTTTPLATRPASSSTPTTTDKVSAAVTSKQSATDLYLAALEQKRLNQFSAAYDSLQQARQQTVPTQKEYAIIQDELHIELPLAEARFYLQQHDAVKVNSLLEPVIGYLKTHPKRIEYMQQVESILTSVGYLKQSQELSSRSTLENIKRMMQQHLATHNSYPKTRQDLMTYLKQLPGVFDQFDVRSYRTAGEKYQLVLFDKQNRKEFTLQDS